MRVGIVGAGIIGTYLGYRLSRISDVTIFERKNNFGGKPCSGLISERIWNFIPRRDDLVVNTISEARIHFGKKIVRLMFKPKMLVFDRQKLDEYVGKLAKEDGVRILFKRNINDIIIRSDGKYELDNMRFDRIVGCDGANSTVRKKFSADRPKFRLGIYCYTNEKCSDNYVDTWPVRDGFLWKIPRGNGIEWGVIAPLADARKTFEQLVELNELTPNKIHSNIIPEGLCFSKDNKVVLCGDAMGLTKPWSGGGVIWGFSAVDLLVNNFPNFKKYEKDISRLFQWRIKLGRMARKMISTAWISRVLPHKITFDGDWGGVKTFY